MNKKYIGFIIGGAIVGATIGYLIRRIGVPKIIGILKEHKVIPENFANIVDELKQDIEHS